MACGVSEACITCDPATWSWTWEIALRTSGQRPVLALGEVAADDEALDLVGALEDLHDLGLAHVPLDGEVRGVTRAAEHLDRVGGHPHRVVCGGHLRDRRLAGE